MVLITIVHGVYKPTNTTGGPHMAPHCRGYDQSSSIVVLICRAMAELLVTALLSSCWLTSACSNPSEHRQLQEEMPPAPQRGFEKWILDPSGNQTWWKIHGKSYVKWVFNGKIIVIHGRQVWWPKICSFRDVLAKFYDIHMVPSNGTLW